MLAGAAGISGCGDFRLFPVLKEDDRNEKIGKKIRDNELKKIPYLLIVGEKEAENNEVSVRKQGEGDKGSKKITTFATDFALEIEKMTNF